MILIYDNEPWYLKFIIILYCDFYKAKWLLVQTHGNKIINHEMVNFVLLLLYFKDFITYIPELTYHRL